MRPQIRRHARAVLLAIALSGLAAWLVPSYFSAERYRGRLEAGLERAIHRPVTFGTLSLRLIPRPGFFIRDAVVHEDPAFGSEPFARVDQIECDLRWDGLWWSRLDFARLRLERPSLNLVRNEQGEWNVEKLLLESGLTSSPPAIGEGKGSEAGKSLDLDVEGGRINFKVGTDKKPFAITELSARLRIDPARRRVEYRLAGSPLRTDLPLPAPGEVELSGDWTPGKDLEGPLNATLRTRGSLLYDWVPIVVGKNPEIYGTLDAEIQVKGSLHLLNLQGECHLAQLHRWEKMPPLESMPGVIYFHAQFDRRQGRALIDSLEASFAQSHLHLSGAVDRFPRSPELDLVLALERSRLEDLMALGRRLGAVPENLSVRGRVDGMLAIQGSWGERRYGGFVSIRDGALVTPSRVYPVSELAVRIDNHGARLAPARINLAPHVDIVAEGALDRTVVPPHYELLASATAVPVREILGFGRALGVHSLRGWDASGVLTAAFRWAGTARPFSRPTLTGRAEVHSARLLIPGLTEPLQLPRARLRVDRDRVVADPVVAVLGTSVFSGQLTHRNEWKQPWEFLLRVKTLSIEEGALWFDALGRRKPLPLLARLPGLSSFSGRREAASDLFGSLHARGRLVASTLTYRGLTFKDFQAAGEISSRVIRLAGATFRVAGGRGQGNALVDLSATPARLVADFSLAGADVQGLAARLPEALHGTRGSVSATGHLQTSGLSRDEMAANLQGQATASLSNLAFGEFDPVSAFAREIGWGSLEPLHGAAGASSGMAALEIGDRQLTLKEASFDVSGAKLILAGAYDFGGAVRLDVRADLRHARRRWLPRSQEYDPTTSGGELRLAGSIGRLVVVRPMQVSRNNP